MANRGMARLHAVAIAGCVVMVTTLASAQGITGNKQGQGGSVVQGAAGTGGSIGDTGPRALRQADGRDGRRRAAGLRHRLAEALQPAVARRPHPHDDSAVELLHRGRARRRHAERDAGARACSSPASCAPNSNVGGGQMVTADFIMTPSVVFSENNAGGVGGAAVGGLFGGDGLARIAGGLKFKEAQTSMLVADARSTVQVAAAEGSTQKADMRLGGALVRRRRRRRGRRLRQHQRRQDHRGRVHGQLQQHRQRRPERPEPAAQRRHARAGSSGRRAAAGRRGVRRRRCAGAEDRGREAAGARRPTPRRQWRRWPAPTSSS